MAKAAWSLLMLITAGCCTAHMFKSHIRGLFSPTTIGHMRQDCLSEHFLSNPHHSCAFCFTKVGLPNGQAGRNGTCFSQQGSCHHSSRNCCREIVRALTVPGTHHVLPFVIGCGCQMCRGPSPEIPLSDVLIDNAFK